MRKLVSLTSLVGLALLAAACGGESKTMRRETMTTVPAPAVVERRTSVETVAPAPAVVEKQTTIRSGSAQKRTTDTVETQD